MLLEDVRKRPHPEAEEQQKEKIMGIGNGADAMQNATSNEKVRIVSAEEPVQGRKISPSPKPSV